MINESQWKFPQKIDDATAAFPARIKHLMPAYEDIPEEFKRMSNKWVKFQSAWFFGGLVDPKYWPKEGVDPKLAIRHLAAIQGSYEPKHEHKEATVAYLASRWFDKIETAEDIYQ